MERKKGAVQATISLEGAQLHRVDVAGSESTLPSEALAALKTSIGAFLTEYMKQNAIALEGQEVDMLEEVISSDDDEEGEGEGEEQGGGKNNKNKKQQQQQESRAALGSGSKKRARVERAKAKAAAAAAATAAAAAAAAVSPSPR